MKEEKELENYIPFGNEWQKEMKKFNKDTLIKLLRAEYIKTSTPDVAVPVEDNVPTIEDLRIGKNLFKPKPIVEQISTQTFCPTCGSEVTVEIEGETHFYKPKQSTGLRWVKEKLAEQRAMCADAFWNNRFGFMAKLSEKEVKEMMVFIENYNEPNLLSDCLNQEQSSPVSEDDHEADIWSDLYFIIKDRIEGRLDGMQYFIKMNQFDIKRKSSSPVEEEKKDEKEAVETVEKAWAACKKAMESCYLIVDGEFDNEEYEERKKEYINSIQRKNK